MRLIEDLGIVYLTEDAKFKYRHGIYECPECLDHFIVRTSHIVSGQLRCSSCASIHHNSNQRERAILSLDEYLKGTTITRLEDYKGAHIKILCSCGICSNEWLVKPNKIKTGRGCPECAKTTNSIATRMYSTEPTSIYYVHLIEHNIWKIGCTRRTIEQRFNTTSTECLEIVHFSSGAEAYRLEYLMLKQLKGIRYAGTNILHGGNTELLVEPIDFQAILGVAYVQLLQNA